MSEEKGEKKPTWLTGDCPIWCDGGHEETDMYEDRNHWYTIDERPFLAQDYHTMGVVDGEMIHAPFSMHVMLWQHYREFEPRLIVGDSNGAWSTYMTLDEAQWLADRLNLIVADGRSDLPGGQGLAA